MLAKESKLPYRMRKAVDRDRKHFDLDSPNITLHNPQKTSFVVPIPKNSTCLLMKKLNDEHEIRKNISLNETIDYYRK